ncbi:ribosome biogenesis GTPase YlqF [Bacillus sp. FSL W7-1360]
MKTIQWFPGHMAKARREVKEKLSQIDVVIELLDARIPRSSQNPIIEELTDGKPRLILLNKADLADEGKTNEWIAHFKKDGVDALPVDAQSGTGVKRIGPACRMLTQSLHDKWRAKGMKPRELRAVILGIPNVGKSTLMNRLVGKRQAPVGDRPGVTKKQQWLKVGSELALLDTPGILWPKFSNQEVGLRLAVTGAIKDELLDYGDVAAFALQFLARTYPHQLAARYDLSYPLDPEDIGELFEAIGKKRGCIVRGGMVDMDKVAELVLRELRAGKMGRLTLETASEKEEVTDEDSRGD